MEDKESQIENQNDGVLIFLIRENIRACAAFPNSWLEFFDTCKAFLIMLHLIKFV